MEKSENLKDFDKLYLRACKLLKRYGNLPIPTKEDFLNTIKKFNQLFDGHKTLLTAIGKL